MRGFVDDVTIAVSQHSENSIHDFLLSVPDVLSPLVLYHTVIILYIDIMHKLARKVLFTFPNFHRLYGSNKVCVSNLVISVLHVNPTCRWGVRV